MGLVSAKKWFDDAQYWAIELPARRLVLEERCCATDNETSMAMNLEADREVDALTREDDLSGCRLCAFAVTRCMTGWAA